MNGGGGMNSGGASDSGAGGAHGAAEERWALTIATPIGRQEAVITLREGRGGLVGEATGAVETVPLHDLVRDGDRLTWSQRITRPMRLDLTFEVTTDGDLLTGTARAGRLPASRVTGRRLVREAT